MTYEVGRYYEVPCIELTDANTGLKGVWPVLGPNHEDMEIIGFPYYHWHLDPRFLTTHQCELLVGCFFGAVPEAQFWRLVYGKPISTGLADPRYKGNGSDPFAAFKAPARLRRRKCLRSMPPYPREMVARMWLPKLNARYRAARLNGLICPHRGVPLDGIAPDAEGCVTCPGHGLRWHLETGRLAL